ncbi:MAG: hypothetical protein ILO68_04450, partial [Clostridia bacterium]|nr:hypothetical protein [Clostridia bacterium]
MICRVRVPATSANLGSGVDCLGVALSLYLDVSFETHEDTSRQTFLFRDETGNPFRIPDGDNLIL